MNMDRRAAGFTMVETLVVIVLSALILAALYQTIVVQERTSRRHKAMVAAQGTSRSTIEVLSGELREISAKAGDLVMADADSVAFRAFRTFGLVCAQNNGSKYLDVAQFGAAPFEPGDSLAIYADGDSLTAADDSSFITGLQNTEDISSCGALPLVGTIFPNADLIRLRLPSGAPFRVDSIWDGAPVRAFERLTYGYFTVDGERVLGRRTGSDTTTIALLGPLSEVEGADAGLRFGYFDADGNELTSLPLSASDRAEVARIELTVRAEEQAGGGSGPETHTDVLVTDLHIRGHAGVLDTS